MYCGLEAHYTYCRGGIKTVRVLKADLSLKVRECVWLHHVSCAGSCLTRLSLDTVFSRLGMRGEERRGERKCICRGERSEESRLKRTERPEATRRPNKPVVGSYHPIWQATYFWYFTMEWQTRRPQDQLWRQQMIQHTHWRRLNVT